MITYVPVTWDWVFNGHGTNMLSALFEDLGELMIELAGCDDGCYLSATLFIDCLLNRQYIKATQVLSLIHIYWRFADTNWLLYRGFQMLADKEAGIPDWKRQTKVDVRSKSAVR